MGLIDFMDESSEMYLEARNTIEQTKRFLTKHYYRGKDDKEIEKNISKVKEHDWKNGNTKSGKDADAIMKGLVDRKKSALTTDNVKALARYTNASDAIERHNKKLQKKHHESGVIEFI